jgi:hypothetical protein
MSEPTIQDRARWARNALAVFTAETFSGDHPGPCSDKLRFHAVSPRSWICCGRPYPGQRATRNSDGPHP